MPAHTSVAFLSACWWSPHQPPPGRGAATFSGQMAPGEASPANGPPPSRTAQATTAMTSGTTCRPRGHVTQSHGPNRWPSQNRCTLARTPGMCDLVTQSGVSRPATATLRSASNSELQAPPWPRLQGPETPSEESEIQI